MQELLQHLKQSKSFEIHGVGAKISHTNTFGRSKFKVEKLDVETFTYSAVYEGGDETAALAAYENALREYQAQADLAVESRR